MLVFQPRLEGYSLGYHGTICKLYQLVDSLLILMFYIYNISLCHVRQYKFMEKTKARKRYYLFNMLYSENNLWPCHVFSTCSYIVEVCVLSKFVEQFPCHERKKARRGGAGSV